MLEDYRLTHPCPEPWEGMQGDERVRTCAKCDHAVYDVSALPRAEAEALIESHQAAGHKICIKYHLRPDGKIMTADCPEGVRRGRRLRLARAASFAGGALALSGCFIGPAPQPPKDSKRSDASSPAPVSSSEAATDTPR